MGEGRQTRVRYVGSWGRKVCVCYFISTRSIDQINIKYCGYKVLNHFEGRASASSYAIRHPTSPE